jgi:hypothetical protein
VRYLRKAIRLRSHRHRPPRDGERIARLAFAISTPQSASYLLSDPTPPSVVRPRPPQPRSGGMLLAHGVSRGVGVPRNPSRLQPATLLREAVSPGGSWPSPSLYCSCFHSDSMSSRAQRQICCCRRNRSRQGLIPPTIWNSVVLWNTVWTGERPFHDSTCSSSITPNGFHIGCG